MNNKITFSQKTLELLYNIKKIIKDNLNVVSDAKTVKILNPEYIREADIYNFRIDIIRMQFDNQKIGIKLLYDTVARRQAGKALGSKGYDFLSPDSMIVYVLEDLDDKYTVGPVATSAYLYSWFSESWIDASDFAISARTF